MKKRMQFLILAAMAGFCIGCGFADNSQNAHSQGNHPCFYRETQSPTSKQEKSWKSHSNVISICTEEQDDIISQYISECLDNKIPPQKNIKHQIEALQSECENIKAEFLMIALRHSDNVKNIQSYLAKVPESFWGSFLSTLSNIFFSDHSCPICKSLVKAAKSLKKHELEDLHMVINEMTGGREYICYKCYLGSKATEFYKTYNNNQEKIKELKLKLEKLENTSQDNKNQYDFEKQDDKSIGDQLSKKKQKNNKIALDRYINWILTEVRKLNERINHLIMPPSDKELKASKYDSTQLRNAGLRPKCRKCNQIIGKIHLLKIQKLLEEENDLEIDCNELIKLNKKYGNPEDKVNIAWGNLKGVRFFIENLICLNCYISNKTIKLGNETIKKARL